jgi:hypothetical protein
MSKDKAAEAETLETAKPERRPYVAPTVTDFFQPVVALGTNTTVGCAAPRPPKH